MAKIKNDGIFFVEFPTYRFKEDAKKLAVAKGLRIVDKRFQGDMEQCENAPKLTLRDEYKPAEPAK